MTKYVAWNVEYELPQVIQFWRKLEDQLKSIPAADIAFTEDLSKVCWCPDGARELCSELRTRANAHAYSNDGARERSHDTRTPLRSMTSVR